MQARQRKFAGLFTAAVALAGFRAHEVNDLSKLGSIFLAAVGISLVKQCSVHLPPLM